MSKDDNDNQGEGGGDWRSTDLGNKVVLHDGAADCTRSLDDLLAVLRIGSARHVAVGNLNNLVVREPLHRVDQLRRTLGVAVGRVRRRRPQALQRLLNQRQRACKVYQSDLTQGRGG